MRLNNQIRADEVLLINADGVKVGKMSVPSALQEASAVKLDLVEISPNAVPPVCRIMDYGKHQFEISKQRSQQRKKQTTTQVKEIKFRPTTDVGDYKIKSRKILEFLTAGHKVKVSLRFRGREMQHRELGMSLLMRLVHDFEGQAVVEQEPKLEGRQLMMVLSADKSLKKSAKLAAESKKIDKKETD